MLQAKWLHDFVGTEVSTSMHHIESPSVAKRINLENVMASLDKQCPKCGHRIVPSEIRRVNNEEMKCPACGSVFKPEVKPRGK